MKCLSLLYQLCGRVVGSHFLEKKKSAHKNNPSFSWNTPTVQWQGILFQLWSVAGVPSSLPQIFHYLFKVARREQRLAGRAISHWGRLMNRPYPALHQTAGEHPPQSVLLHFSMGVPPPPQSVSHLSLLSLHKGQTVVHLNCPVHNFNFFIFPPTYYNDAIINSCVIFRRCVNHTGRKYCV